MPTNNIERSASLLPGRLNRPNCNTIRVDSGTGALMVGTGASGRSEVPVAGGAPTTVTAATLTVLAATHANRTIVLNRAAGVAVTLPLATGSGDKYRFVILATASGGSYVIAVPANTDYMIGVAFFDGDDAANAANGFTTANTGTVATESDTITLNGTTTGGIKGAVVELQDVASAIWAVRVLSAASGTEATPFSVAV